ncbi:MAG: hypothetical protein LLG37_08720 [Spirochaetia bacterium]|nr:hypothetical protein [Spirochaetia bacterium]
MKKASIIAVAVIVAVLCVTAAVVNLPGQNRKTSGEESALFAERAARDIASAWDYRVLLDYASPELKAAVPESALSDLCGRSAAELGKVRKYYATEGNASGATAGYISRFSFEKRDAGVKLELVKRDGQWYVNRFFIVSQGGK